MLPLSLGLNWSPLLRFPPLVMMAPQKPLLGRVAPVGEVMVWVWSVYVTVVVSIDQ